MRRFLLILLLGLVGACSYGQGVKLVLPGSGPYQTWYDASFPTAPKNDAQTVASSSADLTPPAGSYLAVLDSKSGNLAVVASGQLHGTVTLKDADFKYIGEVRVAVSHDGNAIESGSVDLNDGRGNHTAVLDSSRVGTVSFFGVKPGQLKVTVHYVSQGKDADPLVQLVKADLTRTDAVPTISVAVTADVATLKEKPGASGTPTTTSDGKEASSKDSSGSSTDSGSDSNAPKKVKEPIGVFAILGRLAGMLIGLLFVVAVAWALWYFLVKNPKAAAERLTALGVQIPKAPDDPMDTPAVAVPSAVPQPMQKIMLEDSAPTPLAAAPAFSATPAASTVFTDQPRLVRSDGEELYVMEGTTTVGREAGLGLSLIDEPTLSRKHAEIIRAGSQIVIRDLGSTNGTYVNGRKVSGDTPVNPGDQVQFGSVMFSVQA